MILANPENEQSAVAREICAHWQTQESKNREKKKGRTRTRQVKQAGRGKSVAIIIKVERCNHHQGSIQSINSIIIIVQSSSR